ncbi:MAG: hypothetical protein KC516_01555 [Nanoarchaeota archaeon]|nr:hypothetical protein [Nanoarchaeota archaeon]
MKGGFIMDKKYFLILLSFLMVSAVFAASISGMVVSLKGDELRSFSLDDKNYNVEVQKQDDGSVDVEINGQKVEEVMEGDTVVIDGAEFKVSDVKKPWLFRSQYKVQLEVKEQTEANLGGDPEAASYCKDTAAGSCVYGETGSVTTKCINDDGKCSCPSSYSGLSLKTNWCNTASSGTAKDGSGILINPFDMESEDLTEEFQRIKCNYGYCTGHTIHCPGSSDTCYAGPYCHSTLGCAVIDCCEQPAAGN